MYSYEVTGTRNGTGTEFNSWIDDALTSSASFMALTPTEVYNVGQTANPKILVWTKDQSLGTTWGLPVGTLPSNATFTQPQPQPQDYYLILGLAAFAALLGYVVLKKR